MSSVRFLVFRKAERFAALELRNRTCGKRAVDPAGGPAVSLTSYGRRIDAVHLTIESIAAGSLRPRRLILWLDDRDVIDRPTPGLRRLVRRGVEVRFSPNYRPHTKYYPYVQSVAHHQEPLVTADDDLVYPRTWLEQLVSAHAANPATNTAHRSREVLVERGELAPYRSWPEVGHGPASPRNLATGTWGHLIVPRMLEALRDRAEEFSAVAPAADDIWLHRVAVETGVAAKVTGAFTHRDFLHLPDGGAALSTDNVDGSGNDRQIASTWSSEMQTRIAKAPAPGNTYL